MTFFLLKNPDMKVLQLLIYKNMRIHSNLLFIPLNWSTNDRKECEFKKKNQ